MGVKELYNERAFIGQDEKQVELMENALKERYDISDWKTLGGLGYELYDKINDKKIYFSPNSRETLQTRYLEKNNQRAVTENVLDLFTRVAVNVADADLKYMPHKDIKPVAEQFLEMLVNQEFMPNTPTLCNAGRALQQLSACFVLPVEDYMATDDIGEDPEKQGNGIYDAVRYMAMIHKSGGGTGFNFGHLRPRSDKISTTFGSSSGPVSFMKGGFDSATNAVNQGGFRRGANMGILPYTHPDIFEFIFEKAKNKTITNFNLSVGADERFMESVKEGGYIRLINPKDENTVPLEKRVWRKENLLCKSDKKYRKDFDELQPSLVIEEDGKTVSCVYNNQPVGKINDEGEILINSKAIFDSIVECAWLEGCPGVVYLDRLERDNKTPHIGKIEATNPCGEQPLLPYEACNLGGINLKTCVKKGKIDYGELERRINIGVHFLDNVIDKSKFPFKKIYNKVHGTRKIGLGIMGWAEMLTQLNLACDSPEAIALAKKLSTYVTETARKKSMELAEERGVFPFWEGSVYEKEGIKVRNATVTTIAPNGTTGMIAEATGGIEPYFKLAFKKTCMDGKELIYWADGLKEKLKETITDKKRLEEIIRIVEKKGSIQDIEDIPKELKDIYKTSHDISPENHVLMQAAFQVGERNVGVDNAVSKTVNLPNKSTKEDVAKIFMLSYSEGCVGTTIFRDGSKEGVYSGLESKFELVQNNVKLHPVIDKKPQAIKYRVKRDINKDSLHIIMTSDLYVDDKNKKAYFLPAEDFQERAPLGDANSVSFQQAGIDRTEILRGPDPNYVEMIERLQSASSNEEEGMGPRRIKSKEHAVGLVWEDYFLRNGIVEHDKDTGRLVQLIRKPNLRKVEVGTEEYDSIISQVRVGNNEELVVKGNHGKLGKRFFCESCKNDDPEGYTFIAGCHHPVCKKCGTPQGGDCG